MAVSGLHQPMATVPITARALITALIIGATIALIIAATPALTIAAIPALAMDLAMDLPSPSFSVPVRLATGITIPILIRANAACVIYQSTVWWRGCGRELLPAITVPPNG